MKHVKSFNLKCKQTLEAISTFLVVYDFLVEEMSLAKLINPASFSFAVWEGWIVAFQ
jgi:hypothetical protein